MRLCKHTCSIAVLGWDASAPVQFCTSDFVSLCRRLYSADGKFWTDHVNNWQHTAMFSAFIVSGMVDLIGARMQLPPSTEHVRCQSYTELQRRFRQHVQVP
jgi:hypothetical protein